MSILFADLVGFTAKSDLADPEDVRARLRPYHARLKREIERFGGTVEKFIGDAVMAVFGAPVAHEDDAARAVLAALRIVEAIPELNEAHPGLDLAVRVGVNTGEGLVSLSARPEEGESIITGDVVNTASRLQAEAPVGGIIVGELTYRTTQDLISYEPLGTVQVKGKADPIPVWRAISARSMRRLEIEQAPTTPFIGRDEERALLEQTFRRTLREKAVQLVTVTGEPGVGKSRLIREFFTFVDDQPEIVWWRQGRSLPYGEGITFWALGEVVKAQAGILESDQPDEAIRKIDECVAGLVEDRTERDWIASRLSSLVGAGAAGGQVDRGESFAAWRAFIEALASQRPLILVFEDLHWADPALLEFIEHLVDWSTDVPIMILCSARPELYERRAGWGGGKRNATTISLSPLSDDESERLVSALLGGESLPATTQNSLLERSGGNPLYAEEFVRMLGDRGVLAESDGDGARASAAEIFVPASVHALIAARLDTLPPDRKAILHDAAVMGRVFWSGAVASMGNIPEGSAREGLHELSRKELVRLVRRTSVKDQAEYSFWHALVRDVAYGQIPRAARARKHRAAAEWIEGLAGERVADQAEIIVHHYREAVLLARAAGIEADVEELEHRLRRYLVLAGGRNFGLDVRRAQAFYTEALQLYPADDRERCTILAKAAETALLVADFPTAERLGTEALEGFRSSGNVREEALVLDTLSNIYWYLGDTQKQRAFSAAALELLERATPGPELAKAYHAKAFNHEIQGEHQECAAWAERALDIARRFELREELVMALQRRGLCRVELGDAAGVDDLREALQLGLDSGASRETGVAYNNLGNALWLTDGPSRALEAYRATIDFADRRGLGRQKEWTSGEMLWALYDAGEWDELLTTADALIDWERERGQAQMGVFAATYRARVLARRGELTECEDLVSQFLPRAREIEDLQILVPALAAASLVWVAGNRVDDAISLVEDLLAMTDLRPRERAMELCESVRVAVAAGHAELGGRLLERAATATARDKHSALTARAALAEAAARTEEALELYRSAVAGWAGFGHVVEHALAAVGVGRCLVSLGRRKEASKPLDEARGTFERLGARPLIAEIDAL